MARKRMIDPEFWSDEEIGQWSRSARLFYIGLWNFADDCGRFKAHSGLLKSQIFPYDNPKSLKMESLKREVSSKIVWYEVNGLKYGHLRNFNKHQRIDRPQMSKLPPPPEGKIDEPSANNQEHVPPKLKEVKLKEVKAQPSPELKAALDKVYNKGKGLNIFALINRLKKQMGWAPERLIPEEILLRVCAAYERDKDKIEKPWPWFQKVIREECAMWHAQQQINRNDKNAEFAPSIKQILGMK